MRWKQLAVCIVATACLPGEIVAQEVGNSPMFQQWVLNRTKFAFVGGRVVGNNGNFMFGTQTQSAVNGAVREQININGNGATVSIAYSYQLGGTKADQPGQPKIQFAPEKTQPGPPKIEFAIDSSSEGRFSMHYSDKDHPEKYFQFTQVPGQPVSLRLPPPDKPRILQAPTIWQLLIIDSEGCRKQFVPMLEAIHPGWQVGLTVQGVEDELVKMAAVSRKSDRKQWEAWVNQLGDPRVMPRERADQHLRDVGPPLLGYLNRLNTSQLDAEQKSRIRRIIRFLSTQSGEDTPEHVASMLIEDPLVWLALLSRPEESTRRAAAQQLAVLVNVPITVDPKADPASQAKARDELRARIEAIVGEASKPEEEARPANGNDKTSGPPPKR